MRVQRLIRDEGYQYLVLKICCFPNPLFQTKRKKRVEQKEDAVRMTLKKSSCVEEYLIDVE